MRLRFPMHVYEVRPRNDHRGVDLISDVLPFARLWYIEPNAVAKAVGYAEVRWAREGERSGSLMRIATTESGSLCVRMNC